MSVMSYRENIVYVAFLNCWFKDGFVVGFVSIYAIKMLAKKTAVFVSIAVSWVCRWCFPLKWEKFSLRINLSISGK